MPLLFCELDKAGNSNTAERIDLLDEFKELFGFHRIKSLMADREFIGKNWFSMLNQNKIPYFIRVKDNTLLPWDEDVSIHVKDFFQHLKKAQTRVIEKDMYEGKVYFAATLIESGEHIIVMTNQTLKAKQILAKYRARWSIEELFRKLKTSGFNWENTHMKESKRLVSLLIILSFSLLIAYLMGQNTKIPWKKTLKCPLYSVFKQGLINLQFLISRSLKKAVNTIISCLKRANYIMFSKSDG